MDSYSKLSKNCKEFEISQIVTARETPTKASLLKSVRSDSPESNKGINSPVVFANFKRTKLHQNSFKSLVKRTIRLNLLVFSLILYKMSSFL